MWSETMLARLDAGHVLLEMVPSEFFLVLGILEKGEEEGGTCTLRLSLFLEVTLLFRPGAGEPPALRPILAHQD